MIFKETPLASAYIIDLEPFQDERGLFARTYCKNEFAEIGHKKEFVQFNHSETSTKGSIRGVHYQKPPYAETKLIRCIKGKVFDILVDIRKGSPTFLQWYGVELSAENKRMIYIPEGFAHGFQTLEPDTHLIYHHTAFYTPGFEGGLKFDDPRIGIDWPLAPTVLSEKDQKYSLIDDTFTGVSL